MSWLSSCALVPYSEILGSVRQLWTPDSTPVDSYSALSQPNLHSNGSAHPKPILGWLPSPQPPLNFS